MNNNLRALSVKLIIYKQEQDYNVLVNWGTSILLCMSTYEVPEIINFKFKFKSPVSLALHRFCCITESMDGFVVHCPVLVSVLFFFPFLPFFISLLTIQSFPVACFASSFRNYSEVGISIEVVMLNLTKPFSICRRDQHRGNSYF